MPKFSDFYNEKKKNIRITFSVNPLEFIRIYCVIRVAMLVSIDDHIFHEQ